MEKKYEVRRFPSFPFKPAVVAFDFDGTVSLLRAGWQNLMASLMSEWVTSATPAKAVPKELNAFVRDIVVRLNGKPTIHQMKKIASEIQSRGGKPESAVHYLDIYQSKLLSQVRTRLSRIETGEVLPHVFAVEGAEGCLEFVKQRAMHLYLVSGTLGTDVRHELSALGLSSYFGPRIRVPDDHDDGFTKAEAFRSLLAEVGSEGKQLIGVGDGVVETREVHELGGYAIAVASREDGVQGFDAAKRASLLDAGADAVVSDLEGCKQLLASILT